MGKPAIEHHLSLVAGGINVSGLVYNNSVYQALRFWGLVKLYGFPGAVLFILGSWRIWTLEAQVLARLDIVSVEKFKKSVLDECNMIAISAAIVAQFSIAGIATLELLSQTHWLARALLMFGMAASLVAVYYAVKQQRVLGRLLEPEQVRKWIRGPVWEEKSSKKRNVACEPKDYQPNTELSDEEFRLAMLQCCFRPGVASVLTVSAPHVLLSTSLLSLLLSMAIYLGFVWTKDLDEKAGENDSRNVFIFYIVALFACFLVYSISGIAEDEDRPLEYGVLHKNLNEWLLNNDDIIKDWGYNVRNDGGGIVRVTTTSGHTKGGSLVDGASERV